MATAGEKLGHRRFAQVQVMVHRGGIRWNIVIDRPFITSILYIYIYILRVRWIVVILLYIHFLFNSTVVPGNVKLGESQTSSEIHISIMFERRNEDYWRNRIIYY